MTGQQKRGRARRQKAGWNYEDGKAEESGGVIGRQISWRRCRRHWLGRRALGGRRTLIDGDLLSRPLCADAVETVSNRTHARGRLLGRSAAAFSAILCRPRRRAAGRAAGSDARFRREQLRPHCRMRKAPEDNGGTRDVNSARIKRAFPMWHTGRVCRHLQQTNKWTSAPPFVLLNFHPLCPLSHYKGTSLSPPPSHRRISSSAGLAHITCAPLHVVQLPTSPTTVHDNLRGLV